MVLYSMLALKIKSSFCPCYGFHVVRVLLVTTIQKDFSLMFSVSKVMSIIEMHREKKETD